MSVDPGTLTRAALAVPFDDSGTPRDVVSVIDLDSLGSLNDPGLLATLAPWPDRIGLIGVSTRPLPSTAYRLLAALTVTLVSQTPADPDLARMTVTVADPTSTAARLVSRGAICPRASFAALGLLRLEAPLADRLTIESFAYSMLLGGPEFTAWRAARPVRARPTITSPVRLTRDGDHLNIVLNHAGRRNAFSNELRAALVDALRLAELDATIHSVRLSGDGPTFSSGGDLDEFGSASDLSAAHAVRLDQSAGLAVHRVADRVTAVIHGPCIGAGIEVPAFASQVVALPGTTCRLPELDMGLVPGAGGTASITDRIGPWRTAYMVLSGEEIDLDTALDWGLIDERG